MVNNHSSILAEFRADVVTPVYVYLILSWFMLIKELAFHSLDYGGAKNLERMNYANQILRYSTCYAWRSKLVDNAQK